MTISLIWHEKLYILRMIFITYFSCFKNELHFYRIYCDYANSQTENGFSFQKENIKKTAAADCWFRFCYCHRQVIDKKSFPFQKKIQKNICCFRLLIPLILLPCASPNPGNGFPFQKKGIQNICCFRLLIRLMFLPYASP